MGDGRVVGGGEIRGGCPGGRGRNREGGGGGGGLVSREKRKMGTWWGWSDRMRMGTFRWVGGGRERGRGGRVKGRNPV